MPALNHFLFKCPKMVCAINFSGLPLLPCPIVPTGPPNNFTGYVDSPMSANLSWTPPNLSQQNGHITRYAINITVVTTGTSYVNYSTSETIILVLKPWRNYTFAVAAETAVGMGPFTDHLKLTTPQYGMMNLSVQPVLMLLS